MYSGYGFIDAVLSASRSCGTGGLLLLLVLSIFRWCVFVKVSFVGFVFWMVSCCGGIYVLSPCRHGVEWGFKTKQWFRSLALLLRGGDHSLACRWLSLGTRVSACLSRWSFLTLSLLGVSSLDLVLCSREDLVCRCRWVVSSYWLYGGFGLSFVLAVSVIVSLWVRHVVVYGPLKFWVLGSARAFPLSSEWSFVSPRFGVWFWLLKFLSVSTTPSLSLL